MSRDIVERLRQSTGFKVHHTDDGPVITADVELLSDAAEVIEARDAEIERLRAAGDAMANALDALCHSYCGNDDDADLVDAWKEARRER